MSPLAAQATQTGAKPLVMVVDDDPDLRMLVQIQLSEDFDVLPAQSGARCLELAGARQPAVIILDMMMPGMDGMQVLDALAAHPSTRAIPVIVLSALSDTEHRVAGLERGAVDWVCKPYEPRELRARVHAAARHSAHELLEYAIGDDPVTGLPTRATFDARFQEELARSRRNSQPFSILLIDIDRRPGIDAAQGGRSAGEEVLARLARILRSTLRTSDVCFRYGEEEFAALLPDADVATAYLAAERVREAVASEVSQGEPTLSIGIAEYSAGRGGQELLEKAKEALAKAKRSGGNCSWRADDPRRHGINPLALSEDLTQREWDILAHLAQRRTEQEIAGRLGITSGTVRSHKARIRRKLHVDPDVRLADFVRANFRHLVERLEASEP